MFINNLSKLIPEIKFIEFDPKYRLAADIDYLGYVGNNAIGIQIKIATAKTKIDNCFISERMEYSFKSFRRKFGGKAFAVIFSIKAQIQNKEIIKDIKKEIKRLKMK